MMDHYNILDGTAEQDHFVQAMPPGTINQASGIRIGGNHLRPGEQFHLLPLSAGSSPEPIRGRELSKDQGYFTRLNEKTILEGSPSGEEDMTTRGIPSLHSNVLGQRNQTV